jgi:hypothetical protein
VELTYSHSRWEACYCCCCVLERNNGSTVQRPATPFWPQWSAGVEGEVLALQTHTHRRRISEHRALFPPRCCVRTLPAAPPAVLGVRFFVQRAAGVAVREPSETPLHRSSSSSSRQKTEAKDRIRPANRNRESNTSTLLRATCRLSWTRAQTPAISFSPFSLVLPTAVSAGSSTHSHEQQARGSATSCGCSEQAR